MERDCQHGLYKAGMGCCRVLCDFAEKYGSKNRVLAGFGIGGKSGKEKVETVIRMIIYDTRNLIEKNQMVVVSFQFGQRSIKVLVSQERIGNVEVDFVTKRKMVRGLSFIASIFSKKTIEFQQFFHEGYRLCSKEVSFINTSLTYRNTISITFELTGQNWEVMPPTYSNRYREGIFISQVESTLE
ncbi:hypothetical protein Tco_0795115 [Tanacetum coccineum]